MTLFIEKISQGVNDGGGVSKINQDGRWRWALMLPRDRAGWKHTKKG